MSDHCIQTPESFCFLERPLAFSDTTQH